MNISTTASDDEAFSSNDALRITYDAMADAWHAMLTDRTHSDTHGQNWDDVGVLDGPEAVGRRKILAFGVHTASHSAIAALHNLKIVGPMYPHATHEEIDANTVSWPGFAPFSNLRAALEGSCTAAWLLDPTAGNAERAVRAAAFGWWAAGEEDWATEAKADRKAFTEHIKKVQDAGMTVNKKGEVALAGSTIAARFTHSGVIKAVLGTRGATLYRHLSGASHVAPWKIADWMDYDLAAEGRGLSISTKRYEDRHLELAADLCDVLPIAGTAIGEYYGRASTTDELRTACEKHSTWIRAVLPEVRAALGRP